LVSHSGLMQVDIDKVEDYGALLANYVRMIRCMLASEVREVKG